MKNIVASAAALALLAAAPVFAQELAGRESALDPLAAFAGALDDVALLERGDSQAEMLRQPADIIAADLDVTGRAAAECGALQTIERLAGHAASVKHARTRPQGGTVS